jgi:hypothetical protein
MHFISRFEMKKITKKHQTTSIRSGHAATAHRSCSHCTQVMQPLHTGHAATAHRSCSHCTQVLQPLHTGHAATAQACCPILLSLGSQPFLTLASAFPRHWHWHGVDACLCVHGEHPRCVHGFTCIATILTIQIMMCTPSCHAHAAQDDAEGESRG